MSSPKMDCISGVRITSSSSSSVPPNVTNSSSELVGFGGRDGEDRGGEGGGGDTTRLHFAFLTFRARRALLLSRPIMLYRSYAESCRKLQVTDI